MATRALVLVHDPDEGRRDRLPGALLPALAARDIKHEVSCFVGGREPEPDLDLVDLVVVLGSHESVNDRRVSWLAAEIAFVTSAVARGLPVLGICFGGQLLARSLNGIVSRADRPETGFTTVESADPELVPPGPWMQLHSDSFTTPPSAAEIARNASGVQAFVAGKVLGVQFHPETTLDSFDSWIDRWTATGDLPEDAAGRLDVEALRSDVARNEQHTVRLCDQLVGTFCARNL
jgi:GMP synthase-like glutamine amidotransferase